MQIEFINHASVKFSTKDVTILTDPWYEGFAFDSGWDLIYTHPYMKDKALEGVTHIWISHEHPDHFVPVFFKSLSEDVKKRITILFQKTNDGRVAGFLRSAGLNVVEVDTNETYIIGKTKIRICPSEFYDSFLWIADEKNSVLNINDCPIRDEKKLSEINHELGDIDLLLSQFSYAAWKGGRENREYRIKAANEKLNSFALQTNKLNAKYVIPFASFVRFCHEENKYLNDGINTIDSVIERQDEYNAQLLIMKPFQKWIIGDPVSNEEATDFWRKQYLLVNDRKFVESGHSNNIKSLCESFIRYRKRMIQQNNLFLMWLARYNPFIRALEPVNVYITDLELSLSISIIDKITILKENNKPDIEMHSNSLKFIFENDFGFDTLTVNGRFEASKDGFAKVVKSFALGSLNALGLKLGFSLAQRLDVIILLLSRLREVEDKMANI